MSYVHGIPGNNKRHHYRTRLNIRLKFVTLLHCQAVTYSDSNFDNIGSAHIYTDTLLINDRISDNSPYALASADNLIT